MTASTPFRSGSVGAVDPCRSHLIGDSGLVEGDERHHALVPSEEFVPVGALELTASVASGSRTTSVRCRERGALLLTAVFVAVAGSLAWLHAGHGAGPGGERGHVVVAVAAKPDRLPRDSARTWRRPGPASQELGARRVGATRHGGARRQRTLASSRPTGRVTTRPALPVRPTRHPHVYLTASRPERPTPNCEFEPSCDAAGGGL